MSWWSGLSVQESLQDAQTNFYVELYFQERGHTVTLTTRESISGLSFTFTEGLSSTNDSLGLGLGLGLELGLGVSHNVTPALKVGGISILTIH